MPGGGPSSTGPLARLLAPRASGVFAVLFVLGVTVALHRPAFTAAEAWFEWDVAEQYWPDLVFLCGALHDGELPSWNPWDRGGYPFYADPQAGTFHPLNAMICAVAGPAPSMAWATLRVVLGFALAGLFGLLWLRRIGASWAGAVVGAVLIEAAPFMRHSWELNLSTGFAYAPLMLWAADRLVFERRLRDAVVVALATALCGWVGSPPALWFAASLTLLYSAFRVAELARVDRVALRELAAPGLLAVALTLGLLGVVLVPGAQLAAHSVQAGRSFASIAEGRVEGEQLLALVWPRPGNHLFVGWVAFAAIPLALRGRASGLASFWVAIGVLSVLLAMGGEVFRWAFEIVPGVRHFRGPVRYEAWLGPASGGLAALGLTALGQRRFPRQPPGWVAAALLGVGGLLCFFVGHFTVGGLLCAAGLVSGALALGATDSIWVGAALAVIVLCDVTQALPDHRHMRVGPGPTSSSRESEVLTAAGGTSLDYRVMDEFALSCRAGTRTARRDFRGYQDPLLLKSYERVIGSLREHPELAPQFGVRYALQGPHFIHGWDRHYLPPPPVLAARLGATERWRDAEERVVMELPGALPLAYFVPAAEVEQTPTRRAALARVRALAPSAIAILDEEAIALSPPPRSGARARSGAEVVSATGLRLTRDAVAFRLNAPSDGVVVVNEAWYPGWRATVDGRPRPVFRANGLVRAVEVSAGTHEIELRFLPDDGPVWRWIYLASLGLALGLLVFDLFRRRSRRRRAGGQAEPTEVS